MKRSPFAAGMAAAVLAAAWMYTVPASAETGVTDDTIKIGALGVLTGPNAKFGDTIYNGVEAVYKEANAAGGIHGRMIEYVREDDRCQASDAVGAVKKLIHQHEVFMIHGGALLEREPRREARDRGRRRSVGHHRLHRRLPHGSRASEDLHDDARGLDGELRPGAVRG